MPCIGCPEPKEPTVQRAVGFRVWYIGGAVFDGDASVWASMPDDGVLAVKVFFSDGTARNCSGNDWYGLLILAPDLWTIIHNNNADNAERYDTVIWKRGKWTTEQEMNVVTGAMSGD